MIKSEECNHPSLSSSTASEPSPDKENKSIDTVSKLFSNLFKNSGSTNNLNKSFISLTGSRNIDNLPVIEKPCTSVQEVRTEDLKLTNPNSFPTAIIETPTVNNNPKSQTETTQSLAVSKNTIVLDRHKNICPSQSSRIPVLNSRVDDGPSFDDDRRSSNTSASTRNHSRKSSCSRIPVSIKRRYVDVQIQNRCTIPQQHYYRPPFQNTIRQTSFKPVQKRTENSVSGKYNHVKSKLATYIHRPTKSDCVRNNRSMSMSPVDRKKHEVYPQYSMLKRASSRTSLDTYICDYKTPILDLSSYDCEKFDDHIAPSEKVRKHFELAAEYSKMKLEKERIIAREQQSALEHSEKANDCMQKAIALLLSNLSEKS